MTFEEAKKSYEGCHWCNGRWKPYSKSLCSSRHEQPKYTYAKALEYARKMGLRTKFPL
jgi:hypothetical protein